MTQTIAELKKNRAASLATLTAAADKVNATGAPPQDDTYWQAVVDKAGNGYAVIRFLDSPPGEDLPFVKLFNHAFQGPGGWYIENSLTTLGQPDPMSEFNSELWNSVDEDKSPERDQVRKQKRKLNFISNILVIKHPGRPEDEGKVFKFKYGKKIFDKLNKKMNPDIPDVVALNPFDFWEGANFRLIINKDGKYRSYNDSEFAERGPLSDNDEEIDRIWRSTYSLAAEIAPDKFKSYDDLKKRMDQVLKGKARAKPTNDMEDGESEPAARDERVAPARSEKTAAMAEAAASADAGDDDDMTYFQTLLAKKK